MAISKGSRLHAEISGEELIVLDKIGEGGQGAVLLVEGSTGKAAVKFYNSEQATAQQREAIMKLVENPLTGEAGKRFIWPQDLVTAPGDARFGYLMPLIDRARFAELGEVQNGIRPRPSYPTMCKISYQLANSYRTLHLTGQCYRDISSGNLMFDPQAGDILICDNDNVGVNNNSEAQILGTPEYMAPELVVRKAQPSTLTDLHSLAVLLFNLWTWHHPLHGLNEFNIRVWDNPAKEKIYGPEALFVFHPTDNSNRLPNDPEYAAAERQWRRCPPSLRALFTRAFTEGLKNPGRRVTEGEWQGLFRTLRDGKVSCSSCRAENLWDAQTVDFTCWHCQKPIALPPRLKVRSSSEEFELLLGTGATVLRRHIQGTGNEQDALAVIGEVVANPAKPGMFGLRNKTDALWSAKFPDGTRGGIPRDRSVPLSPGVIIDFGVATGEILP